MQTDDYIKRLVGYLRMTTGETTVVKPLEDHITIERYQCKWFDKSDKT